MWSGSWRPPLSGPARSPPTGVSRPPSPTSRRSRNPMWTSSTSVPRTHRTCRTPSSSCRAGKHVVCEKPLGGDVTEATHAVQVAHETGVVNTVPLRLPLPPHGPRDKSACRGLRLRRREPHPRQLPPGLDAGPARHQLAGRPRQGGASRAFADIGSHWCDLAEWVTGDRIDTLVATTSISIPRRPASTAASFTAAADGAHSSSTSAPRTAP